MPLLLKIATPCIGCATLGGSLVGSNYVFKKDALVAIKNSEDEAWSKKLPTLLDKLVQNSDLAKKIDSGDVAGNNLKFTKQQEKNIFENEQNAKNALKKWCQIKEKGEEATHEDDLCKETRRVNWLFN